MENVSCILNSIPPLQNGDIILKKLSNLIISNKKHCSGMVIFLQQVFTEIMMVNGLMNYRILLQLPKEVF